MLIEMALPLRSPYTSEHSWARTPRILRAAGGILHKVRTLLQWNLEAGGGGFRTLTPCVPRYASEGEKAKKRESNILFRTDPNNGPTVCMFCRGLRKRSQNQPPRPASHHNSFPGAKGGIACLAMQKAEEEKERRRKVQTLSSPSFFQELTTLSSLPTSIR